MQKKLPVEVERLILALSEQGMTQNDVKKALLGQGYSVGLKTIYNVLHCIGERREARQQGFSTPPKPHPRPKRTKALLRKIDLLTSKENPPSQDCMAKRFSVSQRTTGRVIHKDLGKKTHQKHELHVLGESHKQNRKRNCRKLYEEHLAGGKSNFVVTLDEALFFLDNCNGARKICYTKTTEEVEKFVVQKHEKFSESFMVVGAMSGRGVLPLIRVPSKVKMSAKYYVEHVLKPLCEVQVPALFGDDTSKVFVIMTLLHPIPPSSQWIMLRNLRGNWESL